METNEDFSIKNDYISIFSLIRVVDFILIIICSIGLSIVLIETDQNINNPTFYLLNTIDLIISIMPTIIGFGLASFAIILATIDKSDLKRFIDYADRKKHKSTVVQDFAANFIFILIIQIITLGICIIADLSIITQLTDSSKLIINVYFLNYLTTTLFIFSIASILNILRLIFVFIQLKHTFTRFEKND